MHNYIYQLTESLKRIQEEGTITVGTYEDMDNCFIGSVADYVQETDRDAALDYLKGMDLVEIKQTGEKFDCEDEELEIYSLVFKAGFKENYFKSRYEKFQKYASDITLDEFAGISKRSLKLHRIISAIKSDTRDDYFETECGMITIDDLVRRCVEEKTYFIGNILDYHC